MCFQCHPTHTGCYIVGDKLVIATVEAILVHKNEGNATVCRTVWTQLVDGRINDLGGRDLGRGGGWGVLLGLCQFVPMRVVNCRLPLLAETSAMINNESTRS